MEPEPLDRDAIAQRLEVGDDDRAGPLRLRRAGLALEREDPAERCVRQRPPFPLRLPPEVAGAATAARAVSAVTSPASTSSARCCS